ncbi:calumenin-like protein [Corchorus olitorius]|uniref:Calumenin-like protein n=1 Tax=Corchorus olitorius TaxID=93759 RepID=A0A1R3GT75_9ROSI|nr:calumenin-like protein [Corchorus olitorius]
MQKATLLQKSSSFYLARNPSRRLSFHRKSQPPRRSVVGASTELKTHGIPETQVQTLNFKSLNPSSGDLDLSLSHPSYGLKNFGEVRIRIRKRKAHQL